jgi:hypothetical protein
LIVHTNGHRVFVSDGPSVPMSYWLVAFSSSILLSNG